jgi:hypothetical protein
MPTKPAPKRDPAPDRRSKGLRQAASTVFVLTALLPLLIFTWTLYRLHEIDRLDAQIGLGLALLIALLGFAVFRSLMAQLSDVILALRALVAWRAGGREGATPVTSSARQAASGRKVAALGEIRELRDSHGTIASMWQLEASEYLGRVVLVDVRNSPRPIMGTLLDVTADGVLVEQDGQQVAIGYLRFLGIKLAGA